MNYAQPVPQEKITKIPDESSAVSVQVPWSLLFIATRDKTGQGLIMRQVYMSITFRVKACDAQNLQIKFILLLK